MEEEISYPVNTDSKVDVSPEQYEKQVLEWIQDSSERNKITGIEHRDHSTGSGGEYELDVLASLEIFDGAEIKVLVECKRWDSAVERDVVLTLDSKREDISAHKAMLFATSGFQKGAIEYARNNGIALVNFVEGSSAYETFSEGGEAESEPPEWSDYPTYSGIMVTKENEKIRSERVETGRLDPISDFLTTAASK